VGPAQRAISGDRADLADFPFVEPFGLSSYPYLGGFADPRRFPLDYYSRIGQSATLPVLVVGGRLPSVSVGNWCSSPRRGAIHHAPGTAAGQRPGESLFQLTFYDSICVGSRRSTGSILPLFTHLGLADSAMHAKPALAVWDGVFRRPRSGAESTRRRPRGRDAATIMLTIRHFDSGSPPGTWMRYRREVELLQRRARAIAVWSRFRSTPRSCRA